MALNINICQKKTFIQTTISTYDVKFIFITPYSIYTNMSNLTKTVPLYKAQMQTVMLILNFKNEHEQDMKYISNNIFTKIDFNPL